MLEVFLPSLENPTTLCDKLLGKDSLGETPKTSFLDGPDWKVDSRLLSVGSE